MLDSACSVNIIGRQEKDNIITFARDVTHYTNKFCVTYKIMTIWQILAIGFNEPKMVAFWITDCNIQLVTEI